MTAMAMRATTTFFSKSTTHTLYYNTSGARKRTHAYLLAPCSPIAPTAPVSSREICAAQVTHQYLNEQCTLWRKIRKTRKGEARRRASATLSSSAAGGCTQRLQGARVRGDWTRTRTRLDAHTRATHRRRRGAPSRTGMSGPPPPPSRAACVYVTAMRCRDADWRPNRAAS